MGNSSDWTVQQMLEKTMEFVKTEEEKNPTGLKGAIVCLAFSEDRLLQIKALNGEKDKHLDTNPYLYFCSGITDQEIMALFQVVNHNLIDSMINDAIDRRLNQD